MTTATANAPKTYAVLGETSIQVMSDIWEPGLVVLSLRPEGPIVTTVFPGEAGAEYHSATEAEYAVANAIVGKVYRDEIRARIRIERRAELTEVRVGTKVRVIRGRKIPIGTEAVARWVGKTQYGHRIGFDLDGQRVYTDLRNVEATTAHDEIVFTPEDEAKISRPGDWRTGYRGCGW